MRHQLFRVPTRSSVSDIRKQKIDRKPQPSLRIVSWISVEFEIVDTSAKIETIEFDELFEAEKMYTTERRGYQKLSSFLIHHSSATSNRVYHVIPLKIGQT